MVVSKARAAMIKMERLDKEFKAAQAEYLRQYGWEHTSATPGSIWLWRRDFIREDDMIVRNHNKLVATVRMQGREYKGSNAMTHGVVLSDMETALMITYRYLEGFTYGEE